jgi:hypothetical protein
MPKCSMATCAIENAAITGSISTGLGHISLSLTVRRRYVVATLPFPRRRLAISAPRFRYQKALRTTADLRHFFAFFVIITV